MKKRTFPETLAALTTHVGAPVALAAAVLHPEGGATLTATLEGYLRVEADGDVDSPVLLSVDSDEQTIAIDPALFQAAYTSSRSVTVDTDVAVIEVLRGDEDRLGRLSP